MDRADRERERNNDDDQVDRSRCHSTSHDRSRNHSSCSSQNKNNENETNDKKGTNNDAVIGVNVNNNSKHKKTRKIKPPKSIRKTSFFSKERFCFVQLRSNSDRHPNQQHQQKDRSSSSSIPWPGLMINDLQKCWDLDAAENNDEESLLSSMHIVRRDNNKNNNIRNINVNTNNNDDSDDDDDDSANRRLFQDCTCAAISESRCGVFLFGYTQNNKVIPYKYDDVAFVKDGLDIKCILIENGHIAGYKEALIECNDVLKRYGTVVEESTSTNNSTIPTGNDDDRGGGTNADNYKTNGSALVSTVTSPPSQGDASPATGSSNDTASLLQTQDQKRKSDNNCDAQGKSQGDTYSNKIKKTTLEVANAAVNATAKVNSIGICQEVKQADTTTTTTTKTRTPEYILAANRGGRQDITTTTTGTKIVATAVNTNAAGTGHKMFCTTTKRLKVSANSEKSKDSDCSNSSTSTLNDHKKVLLKSMNRSAKSRRRLIHDNIDVNSDNGDVITRGRTMGDFDTDDSFVTAVDDTQKDMGKNAKSLDTDDSFLTVNDRQKGLDYTPLLNHDDDYDDDYDDDDDDDDEDEDDGDGDDGGGAMTTNKTDKEILWRVSSRGRNRKKKKNDPKIIGQPWTSYEKGSFLKGIKLFWDPTIDGKNDFAKMMHDRKLLMKRTAEQILNYTSYFFEKQATNMQNDCIEQNYDATVRRPPIEQTSLDRRAMDSEMLEIVQQHAVAYFKDNGCILNEGEFTYEEHELFLDGIKLLGTRRGLDIFGNEIEYYKLLPTRTVRQIINHAHTFFENPHKPIDERRSKKKRIRTTAILSASEMDNAASSAKPKELQGHNGNSSYWDTEQFGPRKRKRPAWQTEEHDKQQDDDKKPERKKSMRPSESSRKKAITPVTKQSTSNRQMKQGRWSPAEQTLFKKGLKKYGKNYRKITSEFVKTRTIDQTKMYGYRYFKSNDDDEDEENNAGGNGGKRRSSTTSYLPKVNNGKFTPKEQALLHQGVEKYGRRWSTIRDELLPWRTASKLRDHARSVNFEREFNNKNNEGSTDDQDRSSSDSDTDSSEEEKVDEDNEFRYGTYSADERKLVIEGIGLYRNEKDRYVRISNYVKTRSPKQINDYIYSRQLFKMKGNGEDEKHCERFTPQQHNLVMVRQR